MEEKKNTNISLSAFFLILAMIVIAVMGVFIYKLNNDKTVEIQKSTELQAQLNRLSNTLNEYQNKIDKISDTINSDNTIKNGTNQNIVEKKTTNTNNTQENINSSSTTEEKAKDPNIIIKTASPSGFAGSSLQMIRLYSNGDAYWITFDGDGFDEKNIVSKKLIAKSVEDIESNESTEGFVILKGKNIVEIDSTGWIKFQK